MDLQTSFIPKKNLSTAATTAGARPVGLLLLVSILIFITAALFHGGVYLYGKQLDSSITAKRAMLKKAEAAFDPGILEVLNRLDAKITTAEGTTKSPGLLASHITLIPLLDYLERTTLPSIRFRSFKLTHSDGNGVDLKMTGQAQNYKSVALQSEQFSAAGSVRNFSNMVFADLNLDADGSVNFNFSASVDPRLFSYRDAAKQQLGL